MNIYTGEYKNRVRRLRRLAQQAQLHGHYIWCWQLLTAIGSIAGPYTAYQVED